MNTRSFHLVVLAGMLAASPSIAQTNTDQTGTGQTDAGQAGADAGGATAAEPDPLDPGVQVSLGRQEIKERLASELGVHAADVPMTVHVPLELATRICTETVFDSAVDNNRSCTATEFVPELVEVARANLATDAPSQAPGTETQGAEAPASQAPGSYVRWSRMRDGAAGADQQAQ